MINDDFSQALREAIWCEIAGKLHTCLPAIVNSYDKAGPTVIAKPLLKKLLVNGESLALPVIVEVPVVFPRTQEFHLSYPLKRGDCVLLVFSERSLESWLKEGKEIAPVDGRKFHLSDAIAIPGLFAIGKGHSISDGDKLEIVYKDAKLVSDGEGFEITGDVTVSGDVVADGISLKSHKHTGGTLANGSGTVTGLSGGPQ